MNAPFASQASTKRVIRPGPGQYGYVLLLPALPIVVGIGTILYGFTILEHDWANRLLFGLLAIAFGAVPAAWLLGMSIVVDDESLSKLYLFGALRSSIPRESLRMAVEQESDRGGTYPRIDFDSADDDRPGFSVYPSWVWRASDIRRLRAIAAESEEWLGAHPERSLPVWEPGFGSYLSKVWMVSYGCVWGAIVPLAVVGQKWGGVAALALALLVEMGFVLIAALIVWSKGTAHRHFKQFAGDMWAAQMLVGFLGIVVEAVLAAKFGGSQALTAAGVLEVSAVIVALLSTWWSGRKPTPATRGAAG